MTENPGHPQDAEGKRDGLVRTTVTFAAAARPYHHDYEGDTTTRVVLSDSLQDFEITSDGTTRYYLLHDGAEMTGAETLEALAGHAHAVALKLRTETVQGAR